MWKSKCVLFNILVSLIENYIATIITYEQTAGYINQIFLAIFMLVSPKFEGGNKNEKENICRGYKLRTLCKSRYRGVNANWSKRRSSKY